MIRNLIYVFFLCFYTNLVLGQIQHPSSLRWNKIDTKHFKIIFSEGNEISAQKSANLLENAYYSVSRPLKSTPKKIPLLLKSESVISNGYVQLAPRYMAWYLTPFQDASSKLDGSDWFENLTLHEYRHVAQFDMLDDGFTDFVGDITGDFGKSILITLSTPIWFFEGDAIWSETTNSAQGRGRTPSFFRDNLCLENENIRYSYNKSYFGSYKDYTPNHYHLGYLLTSHINRNYGNEVWPKLIKLVSSASYSPFSFSRSLKQLTGYNLKNTYINMLNEYDSIWSNSLNYLDEDVNMGNILFCNTSQYWTNYTYPFEIDTNKYLALKYGLSDNTTLSLIENNCENELIEFAPNERIHSNGEKIVWSQVFYDVRWGERNYADIVIYDIRTNKKTKLSNKEKYFAPAISPDGKKIAAIEFTNLAECSIVILDSNSGIKIYKFSFQKNEFARMPSWSEDGRNLVFTLTKGREKKICILNLESKLIQDVESSNIENFTNPIFYRNYVLFNTPISGIDEIHSINLITKKRYRVIKGKYGVYNPSITKKGSILYQEYTKEGFSIKSSAIHPEDWAEISVNDHINDNYLYKLTPLLNDTSFRNTARIDSNFVVQKYSPILNTFFLHSWHPVIKYKSTGVMLYSNDLLNTTSIVGGIDYFPKEIAHREYVSLNYARFFPVLSTEISYGQKYELLSEPYQNEEMNIKLDEKLISLGITLPFNFSQGVYSNNISVSANYLYSWHNYRSEDYYLFGQTRILSAYNLNFEAIRSKQMARRDLYPKFGQEFYVNYTQSIGINDYFGKRFTLQSKLNFPGLFKHHSTRLAIGHEMNIGDYINSIYLLNRELDNVRGFRNYYFDKVERMTLDYSFPLMDADLNLGSFIYVKRIHSSLFYDRGRYTYYDDKFLLESVGFEMNFDFYLFRVPVPIELGFRYSKRLNDNENRIDFLLFRVTI